MELFENRLLALAAVHDVLTRENWTKAQVDELVRTAIAPAGQENFDVSGAPVDVCPRIAAALAMTLHELCTNAVRHGSLSAPSGRVAVEWSIDAKGRTPKLHLVWREYGGPPISPPSVKGFGMRLIEKTLASEAGARIAVEFPLRRISLRDGHSSWRGSAQMNTPRVLIVEDEAVIAMALEMFLEELGAQVVATAGNVQEALQKATSEDFDIAFLDVNLNGQKAHVLPGVLERRHKPFAS